MPVVFIQHIGAHLAYIHPIEGGVDPGFGVGGLPHPDAGLPGGAVIPGCPAISAARAPIRVCPVRPVIPITPACHASAGRRAGSDLGVGKDPVGVWHYATIDASTPPPKPVPVPPPTSPDRAAARARPGLADHSARTDADEA